MELGKAKLPRCGINALRRAVHPSLGLAWTDGKRLLLSGLHAGREEEEEPEEAAVVGRLGGAATLGSFEHVYGVSWGPTDPALPALLAVQHKKHVTVWQVTPAGCNDARPACSRLCEREEPFAILPQGCVWHPRSETLVLLTKRDACLLYSLRSDARSVRADIRGSGLVRCAAWTTDGARLVLAVGTALHSYLWDEPSRSLQPCGFSHVLDVGGYVCAVEAACDARVLVATELPLDRVCGLDAAGAPFELPGVAFDGAPGSSPNTLRPREGAEDGATRPRGRSPEPRGGFVADDGTGRGPVVDLTHLLAHHRKSDPGPLIRLKRRDLSSGGGGDDDSSHLLLVTLDQKATTTRKVRLPGLLVPDLLAYDATADTVAVASNTSASVLVYSLSGRGISPLQHVTLGRDERPKGLCFLAPSHSLAMLVGRQKQSEPAFLPCASTDRYALRLVVRDVVVEGPGRSSPRAGARPPEGRDANPGPASGLWELWPPGDEPRRQASSPRRLTEEPSGASADDRRPRRPSGEAAGRFARDVSPPLESVEREPAGGAARPRGSPEPRRPGGGAPRRAPSPRDAERDGPARGPVGRAASPGPWDAEGSAASRALRGLWERLDRVQAEVGEVRQLVLALRPERRVLAASGPPRWARVRCQPRGGGNAAPAQEAETRNFLLSSGGLVRLDALRSAFQLSAVEMLFDTVWLVLGCDGDGFIPVAFQHEQEVLVREGRAAKPPAEEPRASDAAPHQNATG
uniref:WD repeat and coiled-coil-containing protein n=1 Tax=Petromyzon marinus TaxID=7757 RepID=A0AAJ7T082_PETMA|nr:WD repeat and coiled-coil-containing protein [Petromyzon marinus]XP_032808485.1 WD repeat and coiled-coil-containing protein [Petromyzon marinus]XP_032808486.1 WD repeat and coiled-coil-containing protein [Petromyzon marinus]